MLLSVYSLAASKLLLIEFAIVRKKSASSLIAFANSPRVSNTPGAVPIKSATAFATKLPTSVDLAMLVGICAVGIKLLPSNVATPFAAPFCVNAT